MTARLAALSVALVFVTTPAAAHDGGATPAPLPEASVDCGLTALSVDFDGPVTEGRLELRDGAGERVEGTSFSTDQGAGAYDLGWFAVSNDGHPVTGTTTFDVRCDTGTSTTTLVIITVLAFPLILMARSRLRPRG